MGNTISKKYLKGFNNAYFLAQHNRGLIDKILLTSSENDYMQGLIDGRNTYDQEQKQNRLKEIQRLKGKNQERDLER